MGAESVMILPQQAAQSFADAMLAVLEERRNRPGKGATWRIPAYTNSGVRNFEIRSAITQPITRYRTSNLFQCSQVTRSNDYVLTISPIYAGTEILVFCANATMSSILMVKDATWNSLPYGPFAEGDAVGDDHCDNAPPPPPPAKGATAKIVDDYTSGISRITSPYPITRWGGLSKGVCSIYRLQGERTLDHDPLPITQTVFFYCKDAPDAAGADAITVITKNGRQHTARFNYDGDVFDEQDLVTCG